MDRVSALKIYLIITYSAIESLIKIWTVCFVHWYCCIKTATLKLKFTNSTSIKNHVHTSKSMRLY